MTAPPPYPGAEFGLPLEWVDFEDTAILFANHFLVQHQPNEFVISVGQLSGVPVAGTPEQVRDQAREFHRVPIATLARLGLTRDRVIELIGLLEATLKEHDRTLGAS